MNTRLFLAAAVSSAVILTGCTSGKIHEKSCLLAAAVAEKDETMVTMCLFSEDSAVTVSGTDLDEAVRRAELKNGKPVFTGYTELIVVDGKDSLDLLDHMLNSWKVSPSCMVVKCSDGRTLLEENDPRQLIGRAEQAVRQGKAPQCDIVTVLGELCGNSAAEAAELRTDGSVGRCVIY